MAGQLVSVGGRQDQKGMTTAEYAVGTVASVSFVGVILAIINNDEFRDAIWRLIKAIIEIVLHLVGAS